MDWHEYYTPGFVLCILVARIMPVFAKGPGLFHLKITTTLAPGVHYTTFLSLQTQD
jgi:hypothetical protein